MFPYQPSDLAALLANPLIRDVLHQLSLSQLQQPAQPQPRFQNPPPMNAGFASNPILNKNHNSPPSQAPSNLLSQSRDEYYRQTYYNGNQFDQQQPMTLEIDSGNDEFFQKPFFQDLPQNLYSDPQLSSADAASQEIWSNDYQNTECLGCLTPDSLPSTLQRPDSGYPPSSDDSSIEHFEPTNGSNHSPAAVKKPCEKYIRPMFLTSKEYEEMRRDFESNGTNVLDKDDHTWQSTWQKKPPPRINEPVEFPPLNLSNDDKLSHSWKVSENFAKSSNRNLQKPQNIFNGWGLKLEKNPFESHCVFCKNNEEPAEVYMSHTLKDFDGRTMCPRLRLYTCPICGAYGDFAHTLNYCPKKTLISVAEHKEKAKLQSNLIKSGRWSLSKK